MTFLTFGDIGKAATLALQLYQYGWTNAKNAAARYREFGSDVYRLYENLLQLQRVFEEVQASAGGPGAIPSTSDFYSTESLMAILDEPLRTIQECDYLLHKKRYFSEAHNAVINIYWNVTIEDEVTKLQSRLLFHNVKIQALLAPLKIKLMLDVQGLVRDYGERNLAAIRNFREDITTQLGRIEARVFGKDEVLNTREAKATSCGQVEFPLLLRDALEDASRSARPDIQTDAAFPLREGIDAFLCHHKDEVTNMMFSGLYLSPTLSPEQYLRMMKSIWIISRVQGSREYNLACEGGNRLLKLFVESLAEKCLDQFNRHAEGPPMNPYNPFKVANQPEPETLFRLGDQAFSLWPKPVRHLDRFDSAAGSSDQLHRILRAPLVHDTPSLGKEMILLRRDDTVLEMISKETSQSGQNTDSRSRDIDLKIVSLNPVYADPANTARSIALGLSTTRARANEEHLEFKAYNDLYQFQEAITGYRPVLDIPNTDVNIQADKRADYNGRIQIWSHEVTPSGPTRNPLSSSSLSPVSPITPATEDSGRLSGSSSSTPLKSPSQYSFARSISSPSGSRQDSRFTSTVSVQTQVTGITSLTEHHDGRNVNIEANVFVPPKEPVLVLFLRRRELRDGQDNPLSLLKIPIQSKDTRLSTSSCSCHAASTAPCTHATITGPKSRLIGSKPLFAHYYAGDGALSMNLALLGLYHEHAGVTTSNAYAGPSEQKLDIVELVFRDAAKRAAFEHAFKKLQSAFENKLGMYEKEKRDVRFSGKLIKNAT